MKTHNDFNKVHAKLYKKTLSRTTYAPVLKTVKLNWPAANGLPSHHQWCPPYGLAGLDGAADVCGHGLAEGRSKAAAVALKFDDNPKVAGVNVVSNCVGWFGSAEKQNKVKLN